MYKYGSLYSIYLYKLYTFSTIGYSKQYCNKICVYGYLTYIVSVEHSGACYDYVPILITSLITVYGADSKSATSCLHLCVVGTHSLRHLILWLSTNHISHRRQQTVISCLHLLRRIHSIQLPNNHIYISHWDSFVIHSLSLSAQLCYSATVKGQITLHSYSWEAIASIMSKQQQSGVMEMCWYWQYYWERSSHFTW